MKCVVEGISKPLAYMPLITGLFPFCHNSQKKKCFSVTQDRFIDKCKQILQEIAFYKKIMVGVFFDLKKKIDTNPRVSQGHQMGYLSMAKSTQHMVALLMKTKENPTTSSRCCNLNFSKEESQV